MKLLDMLFPRYAYNVDFKYKPEKKPATALFKSLFSGPPKPTVTPPAVMPTPDDAQVIAAKKKKQMAAQQSSGRASTILTDYGNSDKLGG